MGNMCSSPEPAARASKRKTLKQKKKPKGSPVTATVSSSAPKTSPKMKKNPPNVNNTSRPEMLEASNPLVEDSRTRMSSITESTQSDLRSIQSLLQKKARDEAAALLQQQLQGAQRDSSSLSVAKLNLVRSWVDTIGKTNLLDPQDVAGYQRRASASSKVSEKRGSFLLSLSKAEILAEPEPQGSVAAGKGGSNSSEN